MKPELRKISTGPAESFSIRQDSVPDINNKWHYHHELELIHIKEGTGTHFIGDNIRRFQSGDIVLIGANLPHFTRFDEIYFESKRPDIRVAHFLETFCGKDFLCLPENSSLNSVIERARKGILIQGKTREEVALVMEKMLKAEGHEKLIMLLHILNQIANISGPTILSSIGFNTIVGDFERDRITDIYEYSLRNYNKKIHLDEIAAVAKISPNSFCRYFKSRTRKTYSQFLLEIKVGQACKLLIENKLNIKQICYESGFNNYVSFHRYFKRITHKTPAVYKHEFEREPHFN